jgi:hypothetical protein
MTVEIAAWVLPGVNGSARIELSCSCSCALTRSAKGASRGGGVESTANDPMHADPPLDRPETTGLGSMWSSTQGNEWRTESLSTSA